MPHQDAQGRWISDDGLQYWDGNAWRPTGAQAPARSGISAVPAVLIGCGFALVIVLLLGIGLVVFMFNSAEFQRGFCNGWLSGNNQNLTCPFHPSP
ncbi:MAG: hypothetical protein E6I27_00815 [Chloroflexi bacterium]|nr:MAG: hypothetical protein E6I96_13090 [Chloroflexota bacterium]TMF40365.1 MAG: hypothetical protein E6I27_00815 [Chloroflexota bacterium]